MKLQLLLSKDMQETMPKTCKIILNFGEISVVFEEDKIVIEGLHCVVEDTQENIVKWLKPFDGVAVGNGIPQLEQFRIMHIKDDI